MKVLLINSPNRLTRDPEFFPYGLGLIGATLKNVGCEVFLYDANLYRDPGMLEEYLFRREVWDVIGISGLVTTYTFHRDVARLSRQAHPEALLIAGGGLATAAPEILLESTEIDIAIIGEGERTACNLINAISDGRHIGDVDGIAYKTENGSITLTHPAEPINALDEVPFPDWELAGLEKYFKFSSFQFKGLNAQRFTRRADLTTTRGCPHHCSFCSNVFPRSSVRARSIENVIEEIAYLIDRFHVDSIDFLDENFCYSRQRVVAFCTVILNSTLKFVWGTAARVSDVDKDLLKMMFEAGCRFMLYGFESGSQQILDRMGKGTTVEQALDVFSATEAQGIDAHGNLIIGHPGETLDTLRETLEFQIERQRILDRYPKSGYSEAELRANVDKHFRSVSFCTPYPGSKLFNHYKDRIGNERAFLESISYSNASMLKVNLTDKLSNEELLNHQHLLSTPDLWSEFLAGNALSGSGNV